MSDSEFHFLKEVETQSYNWTTFADYSETCPSCNAGLLIATDLTNFFRCTNCSVLLVENYDPDDLEESELSEWNRETYFEDFSDSS